jgi:phosphatidylglycerol:prolipoprotein diacylglycerol transferase
MMPFIHFGSLTFATYGIMVGIGLFVGYYLFSAELRRHHIGTANPLVIILILGVGGVLFSKLYFLIEFPFRSKVDPGLLFRPSGFTFYGAMLGDLLALVLLARYYRTPVAVLLDALASALAIGYGIGRLGCFFAGDGDYGVVTTLPWGMTFPDGLVPTLQAVHPTPLYEFLTSSVLAIWLWHIGSPRLRHQPRPFYVFSVYLIWSGVARFLVEFIKLNPRVALGLSNAQWVALAAITAGCIGWWTTRARVPRAHSCMVDDSDAR